MNSSMTQAMGCVFQGSMSRTGSSRWTCSTPGVDAALDYSFDTISGKWGLGLNGTYTIALKQQITATAPVVDFATAAGRASHLDTARLAGTDRCEPCRRLPRSWLCAGTDRRGLDDRRPERRLPGRRRVGLARQYPVRYRGDQRFQPATAFRQSISGMLGYDPANANILGRMG